MNKPRKFTHGYSGGFLWPQPKVVELAGWRVRVCELQVKTIWEIESDLERIAYHPDITLGPMQKDLQAARDSDDRRAWIPIAAAIIAKAKQWPPRMGSVMAADLLTTEEGQLAYIWRALRQTHPGLSLRRCQRLCVRMADEDWDDLDAALWGLHSWECYPAVRKDDKKARANRENNPGRQWGVAIKTVIRHYRMSFKEVGELYIGQLDFMEAALHDGEATRSTWVVPLEEETAPDDLTITQ